MNVEELKQRLIEKISELEEKYKKENKYVGFDFKLYTVLLVIFLSILAGTAMGVVCGENHVLRENLKKQSKQLKIDLQETQKKLEEQRNAIEERIDEEVDEQIEEQSL